MEFGLELSDERLKALVLRGRKQGDQLEYQEIIELFSDEEMTEEKLGKIITTSP